MGFPYQICQYFVKQKMTGWSGDSIFFGAYHQAEVFTLHRIRGPPHFQHFQKLPHCMKMAINPIIQKRKIHTRYLSQITCELVGTFMVIFLPAPGILSFVLVMIEFSFLAAYPWIERQSRHININV